ncbi:hypothetical protein K435DRAFT_706885, partial [Dendrothele bispora CBS 962.96]
MAYCTQLTRSKQTQELHSSALQLIKYFQWFGDLSAIENAVQLMEGVIMCTPDGHAHKAGRLSNLGIAFSLRFKRLGKLGDIENAILVLRQAVDLT